MRSIKYLGVLVLANVLILSGCVVRTYKTTKDRVDQDLSGNRGYIMGNAPANINDKERKLTRQNEVVEVEVRNPFSLKFWKKSKKTKTEQAVVEAKETIEVTAENPAQKYEKYTVEKNDTLQKIAQKFFGTSKKWTKIYDANRDILSAPNKIYPGQVINIPVEKLQEPKENLK